MNKVLFYVLLLMPILAFAMPDIAPYVNLHLKPIQIFDKSVINSYMKTNSVTCQMIKTDYSTDKIVQDWYCSDGKIFKITGK